MRKLPHGRFIIFYIVFSEAKRCFPSPRGPLSPLPPWHITMKGGGSTSVGVRRRMLKARGWLCSPPVFRAWFPDRSQSFSARLLAWGKAEHPIPAPGCRRRGREQMEGLEKPWPPGPRPVLVRGFNTGEVEGARVGA